MNLFANKPDIDKYSDPDIVKQKANEYGLSVFYSPRKDKKFRILNPETNKYVDFGQMGFQDFTKHKDEERKKRFRIRNARWSKSPKYSASWLSYYLLW